MKANITDNKGMIGLDMKVILAMVDHIPREILEKMDIEFILRIDENTAYLLKEYCDEDSLYELTDKLWDIFSDSFNRIIHEQESKN